MSVPAVALTLAGLSAEDVGRVALDGAPLEVAPEVLTRVEASRAVVERMLDGERLVYGLNTGLGHLRNRRVSREQLMQYQVRMLMAHVGAVGEPLPDEDVRALMLARVAGIARGGSGAHPGALRTLVAMLNAGVHPVVPEVGSVGASDLMHMAEVALVMIGRGRARLEGQTLPGAEALARAGLAPYVLQPKDGLALISANGASIGIGALVVREAERVAALADLTGALTLEAIGGNPSPFDEEVVAAKPFPGQIAAAAHVRALLDGSYLHDPATAVAVQDPLSFRVMPQVHGALREQIANARRSVEVELNAADDNPFVSLTHEAMISNGNFHPMLLALNFEALRIGLAHVGMLSERRMNKIAGLKYGDSAEFLEGAGGDDGRYAVAGFLVYSAAAVLAELKQLAAPVSLQCPPLDYDVEDHATLAPQAVLLTRQALRRLETILAIEALLAVDGLDHLDTLPRLGAGTHAAYQSVRAILRVAGRDASTAEVLEAVRRTLAQHVDG
jgi:histidine ammonia-lyase